MSSFVLCLPGSLHPPLYFLRTLICLKPGANADLWHPNQASCFYFHHHFHFLSSPDSNSSYYTISCFDPLVAILPTYPFQFIPSIIPPFFFCCLTSPYQLSSFLDATTPLLISTLNFFCLIALGVMRAADYARWWSTYCRQGCHQSLVHPRFISTVLHKESCVYFSVCKRTEAKAKCYWVAIRSRLNRQKGQTVAVIPQ